MGTQWDLFLDTAGHAPNLAAIIGMDAPSSGTFILGSEILVDIFGGNLLFYLTQPHTGNVVTFSLNVPNDPVFCQFEVYAQGVVLGDTDATLSNAIDAVVAP